MSTKESKTSIKEREYTDVHNDHREKCVICNGEDPDWQIWGLPVHRDCEITFQKEFYSQIRK